MVGLVFAMQGRGPHRRPAARLGVPRFWAVNNPVVLIKVPSDSVVSG
jgi:hypothetical protein